MKKLLATFSALAACLTASAVPLIVYKTNTVDSVKVEFQWRYDADFTAHTAKLLTITPKPTEELEIPSSLHISGINETLAVVEIGESAFENARALMSVKIPSSVEKIGDFAFSNCTALSSLELSYGIRRIGKRPFVNTAIPELELPDTLIEMDGNITAGALYDMKLIISDSSHFAFSDDGVLYNKDFTKLYACPTRAEGTITIPESVTNICADAFFGCFRLTYLNLPAAVNAIGSGAFNVGGIWPGLSAPESTPKLQSVFYNGSVPNAPDDIYDGAPDSLTSYVFSAGWDNPWKGRPVFIIDNAKPPVLSVKDDNGITWYYRIVNGSVEIYNEDANGNAIAAISPTSTSGARYYEDKDSTTYKMALKIPNSINGYAVTRIGNHAFDGCKALTYVGFPSSVEEVGDYAFKDCTAVRAIDFIDNVPFLATDGKIALPSGVTKLGYHPFEGMKASSMSIPYTVSEADGNPLAGMQFIATVEVDANNPKFYSSGNVIYDKRHAKVVGVPANYDIASISFLATVTEIGSEAMLGCANLGTVTLPASLATISSNAFAGCSSLEVVTIPATVTEIGSTAFTNCSSLVKMVYEGNAPTTTDDLYAGTPETMTSWVNKDATGFAEGTWRNRPVVVMTDPDGGEQELSYSYGGTTWYFRVVDGYAEIWRKGEQTAIVSDEPIMNLSLPEVLGGHLVKGIGNGALSDLRGITSISVPDRYEWIGDYAFSNCTSLASVSLGTGVERIGKWPFYGTKITELKIPDSVMEIDGNPVAGCRLMQAVSVADTQPCFSVDADGLLYDKKRETLYACPATKTTISLPGSLETINDDAFYGCDLLEDSAITIDGTTWSFEVADGKATITGVDGASGTVTIPAALGPYPVAGIADGTFAESGEVTAFESKSDAFATRNGVLYTADGKELICVPATMRLPCLEITSNSTVYIVETVDAGTSGGLPQVESSTTTNVVGTKVTTKQIPGDVTMDALLGGVTKIRGYAFSGVNEFTGETSVTTNGTSAGVCIPGDGRAYAYVTNTLSLVSVTYSSEIDVPASVEVDEHAFDDSGVSRKTGNGVGVGKVYPALRDTGNSGKFNQAFAKTQTVSGALVDADGNLVGVVQIKAGKKNRNGSVKISATATLANGKKVKASSTWSDAVANSAGGAPRTTLEFKAPVGALAFEMNAAGEFSLKSGSTAMVSTKIGGDLAKGKMVFSTNFDELPEFGAGSYVLMDALPIAVEVAVTGGKKLDAGKTPTVKFKKDKANGEYALVGLGDSAKPNVSALKLNYTPGTGVLKGSFKLYATNEAGSTPKLKKYTVNLTGFVVDGVGYATATLKKPSASWSATLE